MGAAAKIGKLPLAIGADRLFSKRIDELAFVGIVFKALFRIFFGGKFDTLRFVIFADDCFDFLFDASEIRIGDGQVGKIVIKTVFNRGANRRLYIGPYPHDRLRQNVSRGMPKHFLALRIVEI